MILYKFPRIIHPQACNYYHENALLQNPHYNRRNPWFEHDIIHKEDHFFRFLQLSYFSFRITRSRGHLAYHFPSIHRMYHLLNSSGIHSYSFYRLKIQFLHLSVFKANLCLLFPIRECTFSNKIAHLFDVWKSQFQLNFIFLFLILLTTLLFLLGIPWSYQSHNAPTW